MAPAWWGAGQGMGRRWRRPHSCGRGPDLGRRRPHSRMGRSAAGPRLSDGVGGWGVWGGYGQGGGGGTRLRRQGGRPGSGGGRRHRPKPSHREPRPAAICNKGPETKACAAVPVRWAALRDQCGSNRSLLLIFTSLLPITATFLLPLLPVVHHYYVKTGPLLLIFTAVITSFLPIVTSVITSLLPVVPVIMNPLLQ